MLGALYTVLSGILKHLGDALAADLPGCPEMSAYARRLYAADLAFPELGLYHAYSKHTGDLMIQRGMSDPMAILVCEAMDKLGRPFDDTPAKLYR